MSGAPDKKRGAWDKVKKHPYVAALVLLILVAIVLFLVCSVVIAVRGEADDGGFCNTVCTSGGHLFKWIGAVVGIVALVIFLWLFTGDADKKWRCMILYAYLFTIFALGLSILPFVGFHKKEGLAEDMAQSPISVLIACSAPTGDPCAPGNCEWVINIGGSTTACTDHEGTGWPPVRISKGLVTPLYCIVLALMGAAVGMTRRVPEYQARVAEYERHAGAAGAAGGAGPEGGDEPKEEPKDADSKKEAEGGNGGQPAVEDETKGKELSPEKAREKLIFQMMQVVAAPLIAFTAYHLISPKETATIVAVGFASGFSSEPILLAIRAFSKAIRPNSAPEE